MAEVEEKETNAPWRAFTLATLYTALGEKDEALRWLNYERPHAWTPWIRVQPEWAPLRDDPGFGDLLRRMNLPPLDSHKLGLGAHGTETGPA